MLLEMMLQWAHYGPGIRRDVTARDALAAYLDWARRTGGPSRSSGAASDWRDRQEAPEARVTPPDDLEVEPATPLDPDETFMLVATAAQELGQAWNEEVLGAIPSQFLLGLCGLGDRAAFLLAEAAADLAGQFQVVRDQLLGHSQDGAPLTDEALGRAVDRLEELVRAVGERATSMLSAEQDPDGARLVWQVHVASGCPFTRVDEFPHSDAWSSIPRSKAGQGDVAWWPDYVAVCIPAEGGGILLAPGKPRLATVEQRRGPPRFFRLRPEG